MSSIQKEFTEDEEQKLSINREGIEIKLGTKEILKTLGFYLGKIWNFLLKIKKSEIEVRFTNLGNKRDWRWFGSEGRKENKREENETAEEEKKMREKKKKTRVLKQVKTAQTRLMVDHPVDRVNSWATGWHAVDRRKAKIKILLFQAISIDRWVDRPCFRPTRSTGRSLGHP